MTEWPKDELRRAAEADDLHIDWMEEVSDEQYQTRSKLE